MIRNNSLQWYLATSLVLVINPISDGSFWKMNHSADGINHVISITGTDNVKSSLTAADNFASLPSQPNDYYRSKNSGGWNDINTWESSFDNITWENATLFPNFDARGITIRSSHTVTLTANTTTKSLTIATGGVLTNSGPLGGFQLTILYDGTQEPDFKIYGTYLLFGKQPVFETGAAARVYANGLVRVDDNIGGQSEDFASSSNVTFNTKAVFEWNINKSFKTSGAVYFPNSGTEVPVFRVSKDPGSVGSGTVLTINGILDVNVDFIFIGGSNKIFRNGIVGRNTLTQNNTSGNRFTINGLNAILGGSALNIILSFPLYLESSITVPKDSSVSINAGNINNGNIISIEGTIDVNDIQISPNTTLNVTATGKFRTSRSGGFSGTTSSVPGGIITLQTGSTIELYRKGDQTFWDRSDFSNLIFSGSGTKRASVGFAAMGTITIKEDAILDSRGQNIGNENTNLTMTDNSKFIVSTIGRNPAIDGVYKLTGGVIQFDNNGLTKQTIRGTTSLPTTGNSVIYNQIEVTGNNVGIGNGNINLREGGKFTVKSGGIFEVNAQSIKAVTGSSNQQVIVESGAQFKTGNEHGFHGIESIVIPIGVSSIHPNITKIILQPNSSVNYHRSNLVQTFGIQTITATVPYQHLIISGNQEKTAHLNRTIEIKGNLTKTTEAVFKHNNSTILFSGSVTQDYKSANPQMIFNNLTNQNEVGLNIQDSLIVFRTLTLGNNSKLNINADITLQSNLENTANVDPIPSNASINYNAYNRFIVERYIPNHAKAWQLIATPVHGDQTIHQAWQEGMVRGMNLNNNVAGAPGNARPRYGTTITSDRPTWATDGFDLFTGAGPSLKIYNHLINQWEGVSSTYNPVQNITGYMLMVRGDRSVIEYNQPATETTLRSRGKIYAPGTLLPPSTVVPNTPGLFISVGNPYASAIDFYSSDRKNLGESYIIWDPKLTNGIYSQYGLGAYRTISNGVVVPSSENYTDGSIPSIQSGQAFFVQLAGNATAAGSISFSESAKTSGSSSVFRKGNTFINPDAHVRVNLYLKGIEDRILLDGIKTEFHPQYASLLDELDAVKLTHSGENLGIVSNSKTLAIERRPIFREIDTLFYSLSGLKKQQYELEFISKKTDISGLSAYVEDVYLNQKKLLDPSGSTAIGFEVNDEPGSYSMNRFRIVFMNTKGPLPVAITHFIAEVKNNDVLIKWLSENEWDIEKYIVEKSSNGIQFNFLSEIYAKNRSANNYQMPDQSPILGNNFYRLKIISKNGEVQYSEIIKVEMHSVSSSFSLEPNPVKNGIMNLHFTNQVKGIYYLRLLNLTGQTISSKTIFYNSQIHLEIFNIKHEPEGIYFLEITKPNSERNLLKLVN